MQKIALLICGCLLIASSASAQNTRSVLTPRFWPFYHGVASGDPTDSSVILWTRLTLQDTGTFTVDWVIATDTALSQVVGSGTASADSSHDYCIKIDVTGLQPATWYYYRFQWRDRYSLLGRTRTAPTGNNDSLRIAVLDCQEYGNGYFNALGALSQRNDVHVVLHLGDFVYESGGGSGDFSMDPNYEILSLQDYRTRHSHYKLDPDLRRVLQLYPFIIVNDDHEVCNNGWMHGALNHDPVADGDWEMRKAAALKAWRDWTPVRLPDPVNDPARIWRKFSFGNLADIHMLDTRYYARDSQVTGAAQNDPSRNLIGPAQLDWLSQGMKNSTAKWQLIGQQVMVAPLQLPLVGTFNNDQWDGYTAERQRLYDTITTYNIQNVVVLTGDIHSAWANDLPLADYDPATGDSSAGVEFVGTSVTSQGLPLGVPLSIVQNANPHIKYANLTDHGYLILDVNQDRAQGEYYYVNSISTRNDYTNALEEAWFTRNGQSHLEQGAGPSLAPSDVNAILPPPLPGNPPVGIEDEIHSATLISAWPNPFGQSLFIKVATHASEEISFCLFDLNGRQVQDAVMHADGNGIHIMEWGTPEIPSGLYLLRVRTASGTASLRVVKM